MKYAIFCWPKSQCIFKKKDYWDYTWLINGEDDLESFGASAYVVDEEWWLDAETMSLDEQEAVCQMLDENPDLLQVTYDVNYEFGL